MNISRKSSSGIIQSGIFVGLRAENSHINSLHVDKITDKNGVDVLELIASLSAQLTTLTNTLTTLQQEVASKPVSLSGLSDVKITELADGSVLTYDVEAVSWVARELD
jgi:hypothetical protein